MGKFKRDRRYQYDPIFDAYLKNDYSSMFRKLNGLSMTDLLWHLEKLETRHGFATSPGLWAGTIYSAGIDVNRMYSAMYAVLHRGTVKSWAFRDQYEGYLATVPEDQRDDIDDYLMASLRRSTVYAVGPSMPMVSCSNAMLHTEDGWGLETDDTSHGQAGWEVGLNVANLQQLAKELDKRPILVSRLGIAAHGGPGLFKIPDLSADTIASYQSALKKIKRNTVKGCYVLLLGCESGQGDEGTRLLRAISKRLWDRKVVAFSTIQWVDESMMERGAGYFKVGKCYEPGVRDTDSKVPKGPHEQNKSYGPNWNDLSVLRWADEKSRNAKIARNGLILKRPWDEPKPE